MAKVTISEVRKAFGPVEVIHGVDIDIADREFVVLVGPSGCGKSTLLRMIAEIKELHQRLRTTTVFVTHDQVEAMTMADKIVVMQDGLVEQVGAPLDLYDHPDTVFVAGFIGSPAMNLIRGTARTGSGLMVEAHGCRLPVTAMSRVADGQPVIYGIRPEHLELADEGLQASITVVEPTGAETLLKLRLGGGADHIVAVFHDRRAFAPGETLHLRPRADQAHVFDAETGQRL